MLEDKEKAWKETQEYWKKSDISKLELAQALVSADIIEDDKIHYFNHSNDLTTALNDAVNHEKTQGSIVGYEYKEWYQNENRFLNLWAWLGELVGLSIPADFAEEDEDFDIFLNPPLPNNFYDYEEFIFSYDEKKYKFILYMSFKDKTILTLSHLINQFLALIEHEKRLFSLLDGTDDDVVIALDYQKVEQINANIPLPIIDIIDYFQPLDISNQLALINPEYEQIISQGYYISIIDNEKIPVPKVYSPYLGTSKAYAEWLVEYMDIDPKTLAITKKSQLPHIQKLISNRLATLANDSDLSHHEKLWQLWQYAVYLRNLFIAIARYGEFGDIVKDFNYRYKPLWDLTKQQQVFNQVLEETKFDIDLIDFYEQIKTKLFEKYELMSQVDYQPNR